MRRRLAAFWHRWIVDDYRPMPDPRVEARFEVVALLLAIVVVFGLAIGFLLLKH